MVQRTIGADDAHLGQRRKESGGTLREAAAKFEHSEPRGRIDCSFRCSFTKGEFVYSVGVFGQLSSRVLRNSTAQMLASIWGEYRNGIEDRTHVCAIDQF